MSELEEETVSFAPEHVFREKVLRRFAQIKSQLEAVVKGAEIHHVGSTAVPGSLTKGDLDIQVRVLQEQFARAKARLKELYVVNEGGFSGTDAISFEDYRGDPSVGIHLTVIGGTSDVQSKSRGLLVASDSLRESYDDLKRSFEGGSMDAYRSAKADVVSRVLLGESDEE